MSSTVLATRHFQLATCNSMSPSTNVFAPRDIKCLPRNTREDQLGINKFSRRPTHKVPPKRWVRLQLCSPSHWSLAKLMSIAVH